MARQTTCIQWLAAIEPPPTKTSASSAAISSTPSAHPTAATTSLCAPSLPPISEEEFHTVPKYIKGRLTRERINLGVDFFNRTLADKYALLRQNPARLSVEQRQRFYVRSLPAVSVALIRGRSCVMWKMTRRWGDTLLRSRI